MDEWIGHVVCGLPDSRERHLGYSGYSGILVSALKWLDFCDKVFLSIVDGKQYFTGSEVWKVHVL